ncbi:MAG TPA: hypothetical protein VMR70_13595 [Flavisolibacter sp.]|nr:hypothetical protein [Flavisolibacter sp.]
MLQKLFVPLYNCFGTAGFTLLGLSFLPIHRTVDIHLHDTFYVLGPDFVFIVLGCFFLFLWMLYSLFKRHLFARYLTNIHTLVTFGCIVMLFAGIYNLTSKKYLDYSLYNSGNHLLFAVVLLFFVAQLLFLFNVIAGLLKRK